MIINTDKGPIDTSKPIKCSKCRRMFVGQNKPGNATIRNGALSFTCYQCKAPKT